MVRPLARDRSLGFHLDVDASTPRVVRGDPARVRQVLLNLLSNAVKFTHEGGVTVTLAPTAEGGLRFAVKDTGIGIAPDRVASIFESFTQADASTTRRYGGTGLGLSISKKLVALMGGEMTAESVSGEGSTFAFSVDVEALSDRRASDVAETPLRRRDDPVSVEDSTDLSGLRVLVAEDNVVNQKVIVRTLERLGIEAELAGDGAAALAMLYDASEAGEPYDVVLMDVQMPVMDGHEATRRVRSDLNAEHQPRVIALTANAMEGDREACLAAGCDDYLAKPISREHLAEALSQGAQTHHAASP